MGYRVSYEISGGNNRERRRILTGVCFLLYLYPAVTFCPESAALLRDLWGAVRGSSAVAALNNMAEELVGGGAVREVFSDFLRGLLP